jgi:hypothetical protein
MVDPVVLGVDGESGAVVARGVAAQVSGRRPDDWALALVSALHILFRYRPRRCLSNHETHSSSF